jgi:hypothetical protein
MRWTLAARVARRRSDEDANEEASPDCDQTGSLVSLPGRIIRGDSTSFLNLKDRVENRKENDFLAGGRLVNYFSGDRSVVDMRVGVEKKMGIERRGLLKLDQ